MRFKFVCRDSAQNRHRVNNKKKVESPDRMESEDEGKKEGQRSLPTYACGGAIHIKFSIKREAINIVYKHNPIHSKPSTRYAFTPASLFQIATLDDVSPHHPES